MYDKNRFFDSADDWLIAWAGALSPDELEAYLHESGGKQDDEPHSAFAADLGRFYDHDLISGHAADEPIPVSRLAELGGLEDSVLVRELELRISGDVNCYLILWNARRCDNYDRQFANGQLQCIGSWEYPSPFRGF